MKDNFSTQANEYVKFRPVYPDALYDWLLTMVSHKDAAWDCGTGNGQVAFALAQHFKKVEGTDISAAQLANAFQKENIAYSVQAEQTTFPDQSFDLITVAQAIHWFDFDMFYKEVNRTLKPGGVLAVIGYGLVSIDEPVNELLHDFYNRVVGPYWDKERRYVDELYKTIPFPYTEIKTPEFYITAEWTVHHFLGYLETWSAVQHYKKVNEQNPLELITEKIEKLWAPGKIKTVRFPILLRVSAAKA